MKYDLVIRGGDVIDPGSNLRGRVDVAITGGKIVEVAPSLRVRTRERRSAPRIDW
jgi:N-acyl-D-aspartate/D-glutamate deacylase